MEICNPSNKSYKHSILIKRILSKFYIQENKINIIMLKLAYIPISDLDPTNFGNFVNNLQKINE